jgi:hypothetical protein
MASTPRVNLDDSYLLGVTCAICGADALSVNHVPNLPDYVGCAECQSAFLVEEGGDRVFYGQIAAGYEETERFALKQWAWIEAVETRARVERPRPEGEQDPLPDPETIEESSEAEPVAESQSAEEWISTEIPAELINESLSEEEIDPIADLAQSEAVESELSSEEPPTAYTPVDVDDEPAPIPDLRAESDEGLADFFEALTDDTGEVTPIVEPDELIEGDPDPDLETFDADLERLLETETDEDTGPGLPPPPWAAGSQEETQTEAEPIAAEEDSAWDSFFDADSESVEDDAVPVVDAKDETYESMPAWQNLEDGTPLSQDEPDTPEWARVDADEGDDLSASWGELERVGPAPVEEATPETPDWAMTGDDSFTDPAELSTGPDALSWGTEPAPESESDWQKIPGMYSGEEESDETDFLSDLRRSAGVPLESQPTEDQPLDDDETPWGLASEDLSSRMESLAQPAEEPQRVAAGWEMTASAATADPTPEPEPELEPVSTPVPDTEVEGYVPPPTDPPAGQRQRVVIRGDKVIFPRGECAHCGRTPEKGKLAVAGTLPEGQGMGQRKPTRFEVPLCGMCRKRAAAKSEDAQAAQLQAHLISAIVGMILVVGALALDLIDPRNLGIVDLFLGLILLIVGYGGPAFFLLNRVGQYLPPVDARYVRTTLLVPSETQGLETAFEWRNSEYAQRFHDANASNTLGNMSGVKDRIG